MRPAGTPRILAAVCLAAAVVSNGPAAADPSPTALSGADTLHVAPPTGERQTDRASILAALEQAEPGGTVRFARGTYVVGPFIEVAVPRITLAGHAAGTTIRGCDPAAFEAMERDVAVVECNGFNLTGGHQTVRGLTFDYAWHALALGGHTPGPLRGEVLQAPIESRPGGYVVERNTFRLTQNGIRVSGQWSEPAVIRDNRFVNTYHAVMINGMTAHVIDNHISVPEPERIPYTRHPGLALLIGGWADQGMPTCDHNSIARNWIEGHPDAIMIAAWPGGACRRNDIRDNTIHLKRIGFTTPSTAIHVRSPSDSILVGVPIALLNGVFGDGVIDDNRIEGNHVLGAPGLAIEVVGATGNRIANNAITGVTRRDPFPGNTLVPETPRWREANGSGIWLSPGSDGNEVVGNTFEDVASDAVVIEGDSNRVELRSASDSVRDLGSGNRVHPPGDTADPVAGHADPQEVDEPAADVPPGDTVRYTLMPAGIPAGERSAWLEAPNVRYHRVTYRGASLESRVELDPDGLSIRVDITGILPNGLAWEERFERRGDTATWSTPDERSSRRLTGPWDPRPRGRGAADCGGRRRSADGGGRPMGSRCPTNPQASRARKAFGTSRLILPITPHGRSQCHAPRALPDVSANNSPSACSPGRGRGVVGHLHASPRPDGPRRHPDAP